MAQIRRAAEAHLSRESLLDFARRVMPWFQTPRHIQYLAALLERVERGEILRLCISCGPGHGKSTLLQAFLAWFLGREPYRRILALSASEALARRNSRATRGIVQSDNWPWPDVRLVGESIDEWQTSEGGGVRAIGQTGTVTGFRAELILPDDVQPDAGSDLTRANLEDWFRSILSTRLEPNGAVVAIATRWHDDDLIGRLQQGESADQWMFVNLPAIALENDPLGREVGEALWPERWPIARLMQIKAEIGTNAFGTQYQGDPAPADGSVFRAEWLENTYDKLPSERISASQAPTTASQFELQFLLGDDRSRARAAPPLVIQSCDSAWKSGLHNDRSVVATLMSDMKDIFIADLWLDRVEYPQLRRSVVEQYQKWHPSRLYVEEAASGYAVLADLRAATGIPIIGVRPSESKVARAEAVTGLFESGRVKFPKGAAWMQELVYEFLRFPVGRHDDIVDAVVLGVQQMWNLIRRMRAHEAFTSQIEWSMGR